MSFYKANNAENYLKNATELLKKKDRDKVAVATCIRKAIECTIDEVIFNNQIPTKYSNKNRHIDWSQLKKINNDDTMIECLKEIYNRVSSGEMHNGIENEQNPIEIDEFEKMIFNLVRYNKNKELA